MDEWKVVALSDLKENKVFQALKEIENPADIGKILMYHILNNISKEDRVDAIRSITERIVSDTFTHELPDGEYDRIREILMKI